MKKVYLLTGTVLLSVSCFAQLSEAGKGVFNSTKPFTYSASAERMSNPDTTGIVNVTDFLPEFLPGGGPASINGYLGGGYIFGNNVSQNNLRIFAQGYQNINSTPVHIIGAILWFGAKESDLAGSPTSKVVISAYDMAANKAVNTNGSGTINTSVLNSTGPTGAAKSSADILFSDIDTTGWNYVTFATPATFAGDFAIAMDVTPLAAGDTVGLVSDKKMMQGILILHFSRLVRNGLLQINYSALPHLRILVLGG